MRFRRRTTHVSLAIPSSTTCENPDLLRKTEKVGNIARAAAVFGVESIWVYKTHDGDDGHVITQILRYAETPPYLRKHLFGANEEALRYAGIIPPLRIPHNKSDGDFAEGVVTKVGADQSTWVDIGQDSPALLRDPAKGIDVGRRVTVRYISRKPLEVAMSSSRQPPQYWGYEVKEVDGIKNVIEGFDRCILTSAHGEKVSLEKLEEIRLDSTEGPCLVFGSPLGGVMEYLTKEGISTHDAGVLLNTVPGQCVETMRTEEAIWATLAVCNLVWQ
jgi:predicted SPOUT superfamily RNA methylase MTH1